ncbi:hypothetical protein FA048_03845 [Pedobacter polaris]|uniref:Uncharacterized protein n=1 Tax=Pedobacter polaris TaxID=2571273 RepID=A0A4U1CU60_9SPHI|nr:hypothetical protein [Pedobacter polaris]TKC12761.1 hypothetical protein FA048_03845 [Pedobacter polaris]
MKQLHLIWLWIKNAFNFKSPVFSQLDYADYIVEGKCYLVFSWQMKNAFCLKIKNIKFKSILKSGSAYVALADNNDKIEVIVYGSWRSRKYSIKLKGVVIDDTIEFPVSMLTEFDAKLSIPNIKTKFSELKMNSFKAKIVETKQIKTIINISYPN